jgi:hypothetical protein
VAAGDARVDGADLDAGHRLRASMASAIERTVHSMFETTPLRRPRQGTLPTPRMVIPSESTSPTTAQNLGGADVQSDDDLGLLRAALHGSFLRLVPARGKDPRRTGRKLS